MFRTLGILVGLLAVVLLSCVFLTILIDAIAHPEVTESRCYIKCTKTMYYLGRETAQLEMPDTGISRQALCSSLCSLRESIRVMVDSRKKSLEEMEQ